MRGWIIGRSDVQVEVVSIMERPTDIVRLGISGTPALVLNQELLAQNLTENKLDELLQEYVSKVDGDWSSRFDSEESPINQP
jgi:hypothetical protein